MTGFCLLLLSAGGLTGQHNARPSLLLITVDTLRADRVSRDPGSITPVLDQLSAEGVRFDRAIVQVPITLPSHASILTGAYPVYHGIRDFGGIKLKDERETLTEILKANGYQTAAFVSSFALDSAWGLDQGFETYHDDFDLSSYQGVGFNAVERRGDLTVDLVVDWLGKNLDPQRPLFLWVHLFDPHDPYEAPSPYRERFADSPYDGEVAFVDAQIGRLIEKYRAAGRYESSLIVVMGDHGEGLGEHGEETHGFFVYNSTLHVPLLMRFPEGEYGGQRVAQVVESIDVAPTILQQLRLPRGKEMQGTGLIGNIRRQRASKGTTGYGESFYAKYHFGWSSLTSFQDDRYKFIRAPRKEFYDLQADPGETRNLYESRTAHAEQFGQQLDQLVAKYGSESGLDQKHDEMDLETQQRLQSLGYIAGSSGVASDVEDLDRPDPKDKIEIFSRVRNATIATEKGDLRTSMRLLSEVIPRDPDVYSARYLQGFNFYRTGRFMNAVGEFKAALELFPESTEAVYSLAQSYFKLGLSREARVEYERLIRLEAENPRGHVGLGGVSLQARNATEAEVHFQRAVELGDDALGRIGLGRSFVAQGRIDQGIEQFLAVATLYPRSAEAHQLLAYSYTRKGMTEEAARHQKQYDEIVARVKK